MSPFRWDVLGVASLFALPVLAMGLRGDFDLDEVTSRLPWCLVAGWLVVVVLRFAATPAPAPRTPPSTGRRRTDPAGGPDDLTDSALDPGAPREQV
jgi:hypothetical protein